jgi:hypothetical protein
MAFMLAVFRSIYTSIHTYANMPQASRRFTFKSYIGILKLN